MVSGSAWVDRWWHQWILCVRLWIIPLPLPGHERQEEEKEKEEEASKLGHGTYIGFK